MSFRYVHLIAAVLLVGAGTVQAGEKCRQAPPHTSAEYLAAGRYDVAQTTFTFVDPSRPTAASGACAAEPSRTLVTEVWFPIDPSGLGGPKPLIVHSHGLLDFRTGETYLAQHLASWGYVVASPDFPLTNLSKIACIRLPDIENQPADVSFVIDSVLSEFGSTIDVNRIGASGLSYGGATTLLVTYHSQLRDPRIRAALPIAPAACMVTKRFFADAGVPLMVVGGTSDALVPYRLNSKRAFQAARVPRYLVGLRDASHTGFAGPLVGHPGTPHPDAIGCDAIDDVIPDDPTLDPFEGLEGEGTGVVSTKKRCPLPCQGKLPQSAMPPARQQDLTRIAATAFFEGTLRNDIGARCFLRETFAAEHDDVSVRTH